MTDFDRPEWKHHGLCNTGTQTLTDRFFPERGQPTKPAKTICARCPVIDECREFALTEGIKHGVWGGMSERERRIERRRRAEAGEQVQRVKPIEHGTKAGYHAHARRGEKVCPACLEAQNRYANPNPGPPPGYEDVMKKRRKWLADIDGATA